MTRSRPVRATVHVGEVETPYVRAGSGPALVLLGRTGAAEEGDPLFRVLSSRARVVCPRLPEESRANWMMAFLDGLGLERPVVVLRGGLEDWNEDSLHALRECGQALGPVFLTGPEDRAVEVLTSLLGGEVGAGPTDGD